jgi:hypothetical protein
VRDNVCSIGSESASNNGALARYDVFRAVAVDVILQVETEDVHGAQRAGRHSVRASSSLVLLDKSQPIVANRSKHTYLEILLHQGCGAVLAVHRVVLTSLVVVLLSDVQMAVPHGALDGRVLTVEHDVVVDIDAVVDPVTAGSAVCALDDQLVQHVLDNLGHGAEVLLRLDVHAAGGARLAVATGGGPGMLEALAAEVVLAGQLDGLLKGRVADEADEVAVGRGHVLERLELGRDLDNAAVASLGRGRVARPQSQRRRASWGVAGDQTQLTRLGGHVVGRVDGQVGIAGRPRAAAVVRGRDGRWQRHGGPKE